MGLVLDVSHALEVASKSRRDASNLPKFLHPIRVYGFLRASHVLCLYCLRLLFSANILKRVKPCF